MKIDQIKFLNHGYVHCESTYFMSEDVLAEETYAFSTGVYPLFGEIDSGVWAISYYLSMYRPRSKDFTLFAPAEITVNKNHTLSMKEFMKHSCYMDQKYPLFSSKKTVRQLVKKGLKKTRLAYSPDEIKELFELDDSRFERPLKQVGNERYRAMAAIAFCHGKDVFCFPWFSRDRYKYFRGHLEFLKDRLNQLNKIVILPCAWSESGGTI